MLNLEEFVHEDSDNIIGLELKGTKEMLLKKYPDASEEELNVKARKELSLQIINSFGDKDNFRI